MEEFRDQCDIEIYKGKQFFIKIHLCIAVIVILWMIVPIVSNKLGIIGLFAVSCFWIFSALLIDNKFILDFIIQSRYWFLWVGVLIFNLVIGRGDGVTNKIIGAVLSLIPFLIFSFYDNLNVDRYKKVIIQSLLFGVILTSIITLYNLFENPMVSRILSTSEGDTILANRGVGGYSFIYMLCALIPIIMQIAKKQNLKKKVISYITTILLIITVIASSFATAILIMFIVLGISLLIKNRKSIHMIIFSIIIFGVFFAVLKNYNFYIAIQGYINNINNTIIRIRFTELMNSLFNGVESGTDLDLRVNLYLMSWKTFMNNAVLGIGAYYGGAGEAIGIGGHSEWIDLLARFGIFGSGPIAIFIINRYIYVKSRLENNRLSIVPNLYFFTIFLIGIFNPILGFGSLTIIALLPFFYTLVSE